MLIRVAVVDENGRPRKGVPVVGYDLTNFPAIQAEGVTDETGTALLDQSGPAFYDAFDRRGVSFRDRSYAGKIQIQVVGFGGFVCYDYVVDAAGWGTHLTVREMMATFMAEAAATAGVTRSCWLCSDDADTNIEWGAGTTPGNTNTATLTIEAAGTLQQTDANATSPRHRLTAEISNTDDAYFKTTLFNTPRIILKGIVVDTSDPAGSHLHSFFNHSPAIGSARKPHIVLQDCALEVNGTANANGVILHVGGTGSGENQTLVLNNVNGYTGGIMRFVAGHTAGSVGIINSAFGLFHFGQDITTGTVQSVTVRSSFIASTSHWINNASGNGCEYIFSSSSFRHTGSTVWFRFASGQIGSGLHIHIANIQYSQSNSTIGAVTMSSPSFGSGHTFFIANCEFRSDNANAAVAVAFTGTNWLTAGLGYISAPNFSAATSGPYTPLTSDHGSLAGLTDDDHTQYVLRNILTTNGDLFTRTAGVIARLAVGANDTYLGVTGGLPAWRAQSTIDHGSIGGLTDDDHTQYILKSVLTTTGDILYASAANTPARLAIGTTAQVLTVSAGGIPEWDDASGGSGGSGGGLLTMLADAVGNIWTDMPASLTELFGNTDHRSKVDLTNATTVRLVAKINTAGFAGSELRLEYSTDESTWASLDGGTGPTIPIDVTGVEVSVGVNLEAAAQDDVFLRLVGVGGDGATDPEFGLINAQFDAIGGGVGTIAPNDYPYLGFGTSSGLSAEVDAYTLEIQNEVMNWPALEQADGLQPEWWEESAGTVTLTDVDVAGEGITENWERALKVVTSANSVYAYQRYTYADQPRIKSGKILSASVWVWSVSSAVVTVKLVTSAATTVTSSTSVAAGWTRLSAEGLTLDGTYVDLQLQVDTGTAYFAVPSVHIGPKAFILGSRDIRYRESATSSAILTTSTAHSGAWQDLDLTSVTSALAVKVDCASTHVRTVAGQSHFFVRRNGSTLGSTPAIGTDHVVKKAFYGTTAAADTTANETWQSLCDDGQVVEYTNVGGTVSDTVYLFGFWEWE